MGGHRTNVTKYSEPLVAKDNQAGGEVWVPNASYRETSGSHWGIEINLFLSCRASYPQGISDHLTLRQFSASERWRNWPIRPLYFQGHTSTI